MAPVPRIARLTVEHRDAFGIGNPTPRLSWVTATEVGGWRQAAYDVEVHGEVTTVASDASVLVPWPAAPLASRERRTVRVRVRGTDGSETPWSEPLEVEAALLDPGDWAARFAAPDVPNGATALLRGSFDVPGEVVGARLYATALGVLELELNGRRVGDHVLDPGWTSYGSRLRSQTFDVTDLVVAGPNALGARLADGWYRGRLGFEGGRWANFGDTLAVLAQLEVTTADGVRHCFVSDASWRWAPGPTTFASIYDGEHHDARLEPAGWSTAGFDDSTWRPATEVERDLATVEAAVGPPVRRIEELPVREVLTSPSGRTILDFGQNLVGRLRLTVDGPAGTEVVLRHAEVLEDGELCTEPLRVAEATDRYVLRGEGPETWEPRFTFHGFRYAEVTGWPGELDPAAIVAVVCHSDLRRTGWFESDSDLLNRFHENVVWGMKGNFLDVPTDCPQRDERMGWTGDLTVFVPTACFLHDAAGFLQSWLADLAAEQNDLQGVPMVVPCLPDMHIAFAVWADAAVVVPWTVYERAGDAGILDRQWDSMRGWADFVVARAPDGHWQSFFQLGDWLDPSAPPDDPSAARTDSHLVANAWSCRTLDLVARAAEVLGKADDAARYRDLAATFRAAFRHHYVAPIGRMTSDAQTAYALALVFDLLEPEQRTFAAGRLPELVAKDDHRIATGFAGTPFVTEALAQAGAVDTAYELLLQTQPPSWLYPVTMGATTVWERWDGIRPDGTRNPGEMNSFNHYALGGVADWLHRSVAGLAPAEPGYRRLLVRPLPGSRLGRASARHDTPYGLAEVGWVRDGDAVTVTALVPPNTTAEVHLPDGRDPFEVGAGRHSWTVEVPRSGDDVG